MAGVAVVAGVDVDVGVEAWRGGGGGRDGDGGEKENGRDTAAGLAMGARLAATRAVTAAAVLLSGCSMVGEGVGWVARRVVMGVQRCERLQSTVPVLARRKVRPW